MQCHCAYTFQVQLGNLPQQYQEIVSDTGREVSAPRDSIRSEHTSIIAPRYPRITKAVLREEIMESCWHLMTRTTMPSWVSRAPSDWGKTSRGKLSADQWGVISSVHLPLTLILLWGISGSDYELSMLDNFMDLVQAIEIADLHAISSNQVSELETFIHRYLEKYMDLYKDAKIKPIHHAAKHYPSTLTAFGPSPGHSGQYYERHINHLHHLDTNMKRGRS
jgi:hypothetical protein